MNSTRRTAVHEVNSNADSVVQGIDTVFPSFKDSVMHYPLDFNAMQGCDASCMERSLSEAMSHIGCEYRTASGAMDGTMRIATDKGVVELDLSNEADRTYAMELAALHKAVDDVVSETRTGAAAASRELPKYLDCTMMGMQLMRDTYGPDSDQFHAAHHALGGLTHCLMDDLWSCHGNRAYGQMTLLGDMSRGCGMGGGPRQRLMSWQKTNQPMRWRALQEQPAGQAEPSRTDGARWSITALTWTAFWVLLWFTWVGLYSLCTMSFKQDSLLYSKNKSE